MPPSGRICRVSNGAGRPAKDEKGRAWNEIEPVRGDGKDKDVRQMSLDLFDTPFCHLLHLFRCWFVRRGLFVLYV